MKIEIHSSIHKDEFEISNMNMFYMVQNDRNILTNIKGHHIAT